MESLAAIPWSDIYNTVSDDHLLSLTDLLHHDDDNDNDTAASPLFLVPQVANSDPATMFPVPGSTAYFGPTIGAVENALSITPRSRNLQSSTHIPRTTAGSSIRERVTVNNVEHKYSIRIKSCDGNSLADDGYKWRKYGQKSIKNSPNPRSYYRCSNPRCSAKKQVERSIEDPDTFVITYEGLHLHFAYPFFLMGQSPQDQSPTKKPKMFGPDMEAHKMPTFITPGPLLPDNPKEATGPQGLLEDVVPWMIRNPSTNHNTLSNSSFCSSYRSPPMSPPSPSTCPTFAPSYFSYFWEI
ncbi:probable WRKY transcription factor 49 [Cucurbita moschata]|uniref:Probable WRKY transcription factor 49 n=1 Tax=Cucurbita moschata TaxID=3662 RepID=A0A6J1GFI9_CUCMO|nr:probable WRKY transcription factor 49 [Cucurbita moschata]